MPTVSTRVSTLIVFPCTENSSPIDSVHLEQSRAAADNSGVRTHTHRNRPKAECRQARHAPTPTLLFIRYIAPNDRSGRHGAVHCGLERRCDAPLLPQCDLERRARIARKFI